MANVDPITLEIVRARLDGIVREMEVAVFRTGYSTIVRESRDPVHEYDRIAKGGKAKLLADRTPIPPPAVPFAQPAGYRFLIQQLGHVISGEMGIGRSALHQPPRRKGVPEDHFSKPRKGLKHHPPTRTFRVLSVSAGSFLPPSSSGLGYLVLSQKTGVRFPVGVFNAT